MDKEFILNEGKITEYEKKIIEKCVRIRTEPYSSEVIGLNINGVYFPKESIKRLYELLYKPNTNNDEWMSGHYPVLEGNYDVILNNGSIMRNVYWDSFDFYNTNEIITPEVTKWRKIIDE